MFVFQDALRAYPHNIKCKRLNSRLKGFMLLEADAHRAAEDGCPPWECIDKINAILKICENCSCRQESMTPDMLLFHCST
jgi:hypothetical protein